MADPLPPRKMKGRIYEHEPGAKNLDKMARPSDWSEIYEGPQHDEGEPSPYVHTYEPNPGGGSPEYNRWKMREVPTMRKGGMVKHGSSTSVACSNNKIVR